MRTNLYRTLAIIAVIAALAIAALLAWLFSVDGTLGLYQWMPGYRMIFQVVGGLGLVALLLAAIAFLLRRSTPFVRRAAALLALVVSVLDIVVAAGVAGYLLTVSLPLAATTPPLLLLTDGVGAQGVPNMALTFRTAAPTQHVVRYGVGELNQQVAESAPAREHTLLLRDLQPGTRYRWQLDDGEVASILTPAGRGTSKNDVLYRFGVSGDAHFGGDISASARGGDPAVVRSILNYASQPDKNFHAFYVVGDLVNFGMDAPSWQLTLDTLAAPSRSVPLRPVMGNHDALINGAPRYEAYLYPAALPTPSGSRTYHRIDAGAVHLLMPKMLWGVESFDPAQRAWFERECAAIPQDDWTVVLMHSMVYSSGNDWEGYPWYDPAAMVTQIAPLFERCGVDLVVSGHNHHMEFLQHNGISYAVIGAFGGPFDPDRQHISPASRWYRSATHGFLEVAIRADQAELTFRDKTGGALQAFTIARNR